MKHLLVLSTVLITIISSLLLDYTAELPKQISLGIFILMGLVLGINFFKFVLWGWIHKTYDVSKSYPLTSMFFPLILLVSYYQGETEITLVKAIGVVLIVTGLIVFGNTKKTKTSS